MSGSGGGGNSDTWRPEVEPAPKPKPNGGGSGGGEPPAPCNIVETTTLNSPNRTVLATLRTADLLTLVFQAGPPQRLVAEHSPGVVAGSITSPSMLQIIQCIIQGHEYVAEVLTMNVITIAGGVYHEHAIWPSWDQLYGSAGRAAASLAGHVESIVLRSYARTDTAAAFNLYANTYGFTFEPVAAEQSISFEYIHSLSTPAISPTPTRIRANAPFSVQAKAVLRFGMMEGSAVIEAERCVYDPQSPVNPESFAGNGSRADHLALVANRSEIVAMTGIDNHIAAARALLDKGAEVVVVKCGATGAAVVSRQA